MKDKKEFVCRLVFHLFIFVMLAMLIAACCLLDYPTACYCLFGGAATAFAVQFFVALFVTVIKGKTPVNGFEQWATAAIVFAIVLALVVFSPIVAILLIVDAIQQRVLAHRADS